MHYALPYIWIQLNAIGVLGITFTSVGSLDGYGKFACNASARLLCTSEVRPINVHLRINELLAAACFNTYCVTNPQFVSYIIQPNASLGQISVGIQGVSSMHESTVFKCEAERAVITLKPMIIVTPKQEETRIVVSERRDHIEAKLTIGCVLPKDVTADWYMSSTADFRGLQLLSKANATVVTDNNMCDPAANCGATGFSAILKLKETGCGDPKFIYGFINLAEGTSNHVAKITQRKYQIEACNAESSTATRTAVQHDGLMWDSTHTALLVTLVLIVGAVIAVVVIVIVKRKCGQSKEVVGEQGLVNPDSKRSKLVVALAEAVQIFMK